MEEEIFRTIIDFINKGFEVRLTKNSVAIIESYKSTAREEYTEKVIFEMFGSLSYFEKGTLRITLQKLKEWKEKLNHRQSN